MTLHIYTGTGGSHEPLRSTNIPRKALRALLCAALQEYESAQATAAANVWASMLICGKPEGYSPVDVRARELNGEMWAADEVWASMKAFDGNPARLHHGYCTCDCTTKCPRGKAGSMFRCSTEELVGANWKSLK